MTRYRSCHQHRVAQRVQLKVHFRMRQRIVRHQRGNVRELGGFCLEEFSTRWNVIEKIAHGDGGSRWHSSIFDLLHLSAVDFNERSAALIRGPRLQPQPRDGSNRRQGLAAKSQGRDA